MSRFQKLNMKRGSDQNELPNASRIFLDREISLAEVEEVVNTLKGNKAPGDDGIPPGVFKALDNTLIEILAIQQHHEIWRIPKLLVHRYYVPNT